MRSIWTVLSFLLLSLSISIVGGSSLFAQPSSASPATSALPEGLQFRSYEDASGAHRYALFLPRQYDPSRKWPVLLFLHGAGERGTDPELLLSGQLAVALEQCPELPLIVVFPQCEDRSGRALTGWLADSPDGQRAMRILAEVEQTCSVDPDHRILAGWSMGGYGAWSFAAAFPDKWSSVLILAGGAIHDQLPLEKLARQRTPVWAISAAEDPLIPYQRSQKLVDELNRQGGNAVFTLLDSQSHDFCPRVFASSKLFDWLLHPDSVLPSEIDFSLEKALPRHTRYYEQSVVELKSISQGLALRLGNEPFAQLAPELPALLTSTPLSGTLPDITRTLGKGESQMQVRLKDLSYDCQISQIWAHGISGGRLGLEVGFLPLQMTIGETTLNAKRHQARTGPIQIRIGVHRPAVLKLEVQPVIDSGRLKLRLLRKEFQFDQGNWYIEPPREVEAHSDQFTPDQLVTGIIGSLYESRQDLVDQVLGVVPQLLEQAEQELGLRSAPGLAQLLSPLPVLVPDVKVSPAQIRTDAEGVSVICDLKLNVRGKTDPLPLPTRLELADLPADDQLSLEVALEGITSVSQLTVDERAAQVNVLDISEEQFAALADPEVMNGVLPELKAAPGETLNTVLRLVAPMVVTGQETGTSGDSARLLLTSQQVSIDVYRMKQTGEEPVGVGQILFSLAQPLSILPPKDAGSPDAAFEMIWDSACEVTFLRSESLRGSPIPRVEAKRFEEVFRTAWSAWGQAHGGRAIPMTVSRVGSSRLRLHRLHATEHQLDLHLDVQSDAAPVRRP